MSPQRAAVPSGCFGLCHAEGGGGIGLAVQRLAIDARAGRSTCTELGSPPGRTLRGDESLTSAWISTGQDSTKVTPLDLPGQASTRRSMAQPATRLLAPIGVIGRRTLDALPYRTIRRRTGDPWRLQVAHDPVDHATDVASGPAQRGDSEPHDTAQTRPPAGFPKGNLQACARRIWSSGRTRSRVGPGLAEWSCRQWRIIVWWLGPVRMGSRLGWCGDAGAGRVERSWPRPWGRCQRARRLGVHERRGAAGVLVGSTQAAAAAGADPTRGL